MRVSSLLAALILASVSLQAAPAPISEERAIGIVAKAMQRFEPVPTRCLSFITEERSRKGFEIAVAENHKAGCGGESGALTIVERFRVDRSPVRLWINDAATDTYRPCLLSKSAPPRCAED
jgi:hypothetical protein